MLRKWKRVNVNDEEENNTNVEKQRKRPGKSNYKTLICLPLVWKLLTGVLRKKFMDFWMQICYYLKNIKDVGKDLDERMINCSLIG